MNTSQPSETKTETKQLYLHIFGEAKSPTLTFFFSGSCPLAFKPSSNDNSKISYLKIVLVKNKGTWKIQPTPLPTPLPTPFSKKEIWPRLVLKKLPNGMCYSNFNNEVHNWSISIIRNGILLKIAQARLLAWGHRDLSPPSFDSHLNPDPTRGEQILPSI